MLVSINGDTFIVIAMHLGKIMVSCFSFRSNFIARHHGVMIISLMNGQLAGHKHVNCRFLSTACPSG